MVTVSITLDDSELEVLHKANVIQDLTDKDNIAQGLYTLISGKVEEIENFDL